jgi:hypothetical protein
MATTAPRRTTVKIAAGVIVLGGGFVVFLLSAIAGILGNAERPSNSFAASDAALADIPEDYLRIYQAVGEETELDWAILAGIGKVETDHGRLDAPGVTSGVNTFGCCAGPMQFNLRNGPPSTWDAYRDSASDDVYDPADAIPASARLLIDNGAPDSYQQAIFAYNHAQWYVTDVLAQAERYRGAAERAAAGGAVGSANASEILADDAIQMTEVMRAQLEQGDIDPRLVDLIAFAADETDIIITSLLRPGDPGNHGAGRAVDIGAVDGEVCTGTRTGACGQLAVDLARVEGDARSTELIYAFDPDGPDDPRGFADPAAHSDHIHAGFDQ